MNKRAHGIRSIGLIAANTVRGAVRGRHFAVIGLLALLMGLFAAVLRDLDFGGEAWRFLLNSGLGIMWLFGSILAVVLPAGLYFSDLENRTAIAILAKPISRGVYLTGTFGGVVIAVGAFTVALYGLLTLLLIWCATVPSGVGPGMMGTASPVSYVAVAAASGLIWQYCAVVAAVTLFVASFSQSMIYTVSVSFLIVLAGQVQSAAAEAAQMLDPGFWQAGVGLFATLVPNLRVFYIGDLLGSGVPLSLAGIGGILLYGFIYSSIFLGLGILGFRCREL